MPIPLPVAAPAVVKSVAASAALGPWWFVPVIGLLSAILVVLMTEYAKNRWGGGQRLELDRQTAQRQALDSQRDDNREMLAVVSEQYKTISTRYEEILVKFQGLIQNNADNGATIKIQTSQIERLSSDVSALQTENATLKAKLERMSALDVEVASLKVRVENLTQQVKDKDNEITRLTIELQGEKTRRLHVETH